LFIGTVDFDPNVGLSNLTAVGYEDIFVVKLDASGNLVWAKRLGGGSNGAYIDYGKSIKTDMRGNVYTTGQFKGTGDFDPGPGVFNLNGTGGDIFVSKLDSLGNFIWAIKIGGIQSDQCFSLFLDNSNNIYFTGGFQGTVDFDPGVGVFSMTALPAMNLDIFICKLDSNGSFIWAKQMIDNGNNEGLAITIDPLGNVLTTGIFGGTVDFDPGPGTYNLSGLGFGDIFVSKLDANGNFVWAKAMGGIYNDNGDAIVTDAIGNVYTTGFFGDIADFDPGPGSYKLNSGPGDDVFISKLDPQGNFMWAGSFAGLTSNDRGNGITLDTKGNIYTTGEFASTVDFDPGVETFNLISAGIKDVYISKLSFYPDTNTVQRVSIYESKERISVYPNPASTTISVSIPEAINNISFILVDALGRIVNVGILNPGISQIAVDELSQGVYTLQINGISPHYFKILKQ
jgi:hypothetical protein